MSLTYCVRVLGKANLMSLKSIQKISPKKLQCQKHQLLAQISSRYNNNVSLGISRFQKQNLVNILELLKEHYYDTFPWIHYEERMDAVFCYPCHIAKRKNLLKLATKFEEAFISSGV